MKVNKEKNAILISMMSTIIFFSGITTMLFVFQNPLADAQEAKGDITRSSDGKPFEEKKWELFQLIQLVVGQMSLQT